MPTGRAEWLPSVVVLWPGNICDLLKLKSNESCIHLGNNPIFMYPSHDVIAIGPAGSSMCT